MTHHTLKLYAAMLAAILPAGAFAAPALAQVPAAPISAPMASFSGDMSVTTSTGEAVTAKIYAVPHIRRTEMATPNGVMVTIINTQAREAYTYGKDANGPLGIQAMKLTYNSDVEAMAADLSSSPDLVLLGSDVVAGQVCNNYQTEEGSACVTGDGILLRALADSSTLEMTSLERGPQPPYLFKVPNGYVINDMSELSLANASTAGDTEGPGGMQAFIEKQAHKQTKKQIKKMARKQIGNSLGGAIGGSLVGGTVGNEAGKLAKGLVGGLFGNKKKKKVEELKTEELEAPEEKAE